MTTQTREPSVANEWIDLRNINEARLRCMLDPNSSWAISLSQGDRDAIEWLFGMARRFRDQRDHAHSLLRDSNVRQAKIEDKLNKAVALIEDAKRI